MAPSTTTTENINYDASLTGDERAKLVKILGTDRPLEKFTYGGHPLSGKQIEPVDRVRIPKFNSKEDERAFIKLHHAAALRWLGHNGYNNEG